MPIYEFFCEVCGSFEKRRSFEEASDPIECPACQAAATRVYSAPGLYKTSQSERIAQYRNEKSAHEPTVERRSSGDATSSKHQHHHHHGPQRPWMLGHS